MTAQLLAISVGPVQEFIAAARRTRDLWFGSYVLSEISKAVARSVMDDGGELIFPSVSHIDELQVDSVLNVANVILASINGADAKTVAANAKSAACGIWRERFADPVRKNLPRNIIQEAIWDSQVNDVIELYAAWVTDTSDYRKDRQRVMRLLAGRKNCRDFLPAMGLGGVPKSSLDGLRESVLQPTKNWPKYARRKLRVNDGEQLDVIGVVKRAWRQNNEPIRYPSVSRIAVDPWVRGMLKQDSQAMAKLIHECELLNQEQLKKSDEKIIQKLDVSDSRRGHPHLSLFPYEGTVLFKTRHKEFIKEAELNDDAFNEIMASLKKVTDQYGESSPYLAVLVADGDKMGEALSQLHQKNLHQDFSKTLSGFAIEAHRIVHEHHGMLIYSGGDDVVAVLPVDQCLQCARALHQLFGKLMLPWSKEQEIKLTLSAGIAIGHFLDPLEDLLNYGRDAEKHAKNPGDTESQQHSRNGLAIHVHKRSGSPIGIRANWPKDKNQSGICEHILLLADWINDHAVSSRVAYDLLKISKIYENWHCETERQQQQLKTAIVNDTCSVLEGKQPSGESRVNEIDRFVKARVSDSVSLRLLASELLVARQIAVALRQAQGKPAEQEILV